MSDMTDHYTEPTPQFSEATARAPEFAKLLEIIGSECAHIIKSKGLVSDEPEPVEIAHNILEETNYVIPQTAEEMTSMLIAAAEIARDTKSPPDSEDVALQQSELSEVLEALRVGNPESEKLPGFSAAEEEYADVIIRILQYAHRKGYRMADAIFAKIEFNRRRPFRHGGKRF